MNRWSVLIALIVMFCSSVSFAGEGEYEFDISEIEKKPFRMEGYAELRPSLFGLDRNAALLPCRFLRSPGMHADADAHFSLRDKFPRSIVQFRIWHNVGPIGVFLNGLAVSRP